jgi:hypothetical protein
MKSRNKTYLMHASQSLYNQLKHYCFRNDPQWRFIVRAWESSARRRSRLAKRAVRKTHGRIHRKFTARKRRNQKYPELPSLKSRQRKMRSQNSVQELSVAPGVSSNSRSQSSLKLITHHADSLFFC